MAEGYRIIGAEMSPYSVKIRSYFRYKAIPHQWLLRNTASQAEYDKYARMPIIPLVITPEGAGIQDSTPIIDAIEKLHPEPSIHPGDTVANFISALIEEFGDEWGNKWMFHCPVHPATDVAANRAALGGLLGEQVTLGLLLGDVTGFGEIGDLLFDERRPHKARRDAVGGDHLLGAFQRDGFRQAIKAVLGCNVG